MQAELQKQKQRIEAAARKLEAEQRQAKADLEEQRKATAAARRQAEGQVPLAVPLFVAVCSPHMPRVSYSRTHGTCASSGCSSTILLWHHGRRLLLRHIALVTANTIQLCVLSSAPSVCSSVGGAEDRAAEAASARASRGGGRRDARGGLGLRPAPRVLRSLQGA
jgi:hypothetical protein